MYTYIKHPQPSIQPL